MSRGLLCHPYSPADGPSPLSARSRPPSSIRSVGFSTARGTVTAMSASSSWDEDDKDEEEDEGRMQTRTKRAGSRYIRPEPYLHRPVHASARARALARARARPLALARAVVVVVVAAAVLSSLSVPHFPSSSA